MRSTNNALRVAARKYALLALLLFQPNVSFATAGLAEFSWQFHYDAASIVEWNHGDICSAEEQRDPDIVSPAETIPGKNCFLLLRLPLGETPPVRLFVIPVRFGIGELSFYRDVTADQPNLLYWKTACPLAVLLTALFGPYFLYRNLRERIRNRRPDGLVLTMLLAGATLLAGAQIVWAVRTLFPIGPLGHDAYRFVPLLLTDWIVLSPFVFWLSVENRAAIRPEGPLRKLARYGVVLLSGSFAPFLVCGPPSFLHLLFPPMLISNLLLSLALVIPAKKALEYRVRRKNKRALFGHVR